MGELSFFFSLILFSDLCSVNQSQVFIDLLIQTNDGKNEYVCAMLGNLAACRFYEGDVVVATLRFSTHEYQGQTFQEILATELVKLKN